MSNRPALRLASSAPKPAVDQVTLDVHRLIDIELAAETLHKAAIRLRAVPRYPEIADYRATIAERFEEAVKLMRETING